MTRAAAFFCRRGGSFSLFLVRSVLASGGSSVPPAPFTPVGLAASSSCRAGPQEHYFFLPFFLPAFLAAFFLATVRPP